MKTAIINDKSREVLVVKAGHRRGWIEHRINIRAQKIG
jgi:hypothetical protein